MVKKIALARGLIVMSKVRFESGQIALARAVTDIARSDSAVRIEGMQGIVFSKDRPMQLHGLLNSYFELAIRPAPLLVMYAASSPAYALAYEEVEAIFRPQRVMFIRERGFRETLISILGELKLSKVFFLVDDILFIRQTDFSEIADFNLTTEVPSLRLGSHLDYCYTAATKQHLPDLKKYGVSSTGDALLTWCWESGEYDWGYPLNTDGNCYRTDEMLAMCRLVDYQAPNTFEAALQWFNNLYQQRQGICFDLARVVNIPFNLVQSEADNLAGSISPEMLLRYWDDGFEIDTAKYRYLINRSTHEVTELHLRKRRG